MEPLREFRALVDRAGGRQRLLLVAEVAEGAGGAASPSERTPPRLLLETFARELFAERQPEPAKEAAAAAPPARRGRVRVPRRDCGPGWPWRGCPLLFVLFGAASLLPPRWARERRRLREILSDVRARLRARPGAPPAVVGVVVVPAGAAGSDSEGAARAHLEALLQRVFGERRRRDQPLPGRPETLQAASYCPGGPRGAAEARVAACRALRAALKLRADGAEAEKHGVPAFLQCFLWARRKKHREGNLPIATNNLNEDGLIDPEEGVALINMALNGNCEEACGRVAT